MNTPTPQPAWTESPTGYFVPRLPAVPSPGVREFETSLSVQSLSGTAQLDHRILGGKAGSRAGFVPTVRGDVVHLDPETSRPLGRDFNGLWSKGVAGHLLSVAGAGVVFLENPRLSVTLIAARSADGSSEPRAGTIGESMMVWQDLAPPVTLSEAVRKSERKSLVMPFMDAVAVVRVPDAPTRRLSGVKSTGCVRVLLTDASGRRRAAMVFSAETFYGEPAFFAFHRFLGDLTALQRQLRDGVTEHVRARLPAGTAAHVSEEERAEIESEINDTWLLWRQEQGMVDDVFHGFARRELAEYFGDMAPLMPYYWQIPVVRAALESDCKEIPGALPAGAGPGGQ